MNQTEAIIVVKLGNGKVQLHFLLALRVHLKGVKESLGESADYAFLVVCDHVLEKLVDELYFEVREVEASIVVGVEGVGDIQYNLVFLRLKLRVKELLNHPTRQVANLTVACNQRVKFKRHLVRNVQVGDRALLF